MINKPRVFFKQRLHLLNLQRVSVHKRLELVDCCEPTISKFQMLARLNHPPLLKQLEHCSGVRALCLDGLNQITERNGLHAAFDYFKQWCWRSSNNAANWRNSSARSG